MLDILGGCWASHQQDIVYGEIGLSQALLADGYNVASLEPEYAFVDFRHERKKLRCKGKSNPTFVAGTEGTASPFPLGNPLASRRSLGKNPSQRVAK